MAQALKPIARLIKKIFLKLNIESVSILDLSTAINVWQLLEFNKKFKKKLRNFG